MAEVSHSPIRVEVLPRQGLDEAVAGIDRSEHVDTQYQVVDGQLRLAPVQMVEVPTWDPQGSGDHSVAAQIAFCASAMDQGGVLVGAMDGERVVGLAIIDPAFEPSRAWLASLYVTRPYRRQGVAQRLWDSAAAIAVRAGARSIYVSATPTGSAVGFYLRQGCQLAHPVHPELFHHEPEDIHLTCDLSR